ncbi:MAG TPA: S4 domain-containing protein [candidate division Zixibacteria bacterium]|nr:S4 domain-containing protein [candidate division Zixibacteria bacterium]
MRIDDYLSTVGIIKRRTVAKDLAQSGMIAVNGRVVKPAYDIKVGDIVQIKGTHGSTVEVLQLPTGSVPKEKRERYFRPLTNV